jgi:acetylglutamate kinase
MANEFKIKHGFISTGDGLVEGEIVITGAGYADNGQRIATRNWATQYLSDNSYATTTDISDAIDALVASAPGTLDTLNELAAALGDDPNFSTTVTNSIATKLPLTGGTMSGNIRWTSTDRGLEWVMNTDGAGIKFYNTGDADTNSRLEYYTTDNGNEYHRFMVATNEEMTIKSDGVRVTNNIYMASNLVATQSWVSTRGYGAASDITAVNTRIDDEVMPLFDTKADIGHTHDYLPLAGGTLTGTLTLSATNPRIDFNGTVDAGVDMAIVATPEGLDFIEPEQADRIHFQILDDAGVNAPYGYSWNGQSLDLRYASAAQGVKADTAHGWGDHASVGYLTTESYTAHENTSNLSGVYGGNNNGVVIEDITVDANGHVTAVGTRDLDTRFDAAGAADTVNSRIDTEIIPLIDGKADTSHNHDGVYLPIAGKAADSNLLDGINSSSFLRSDADDTITGTLSISSSSPQLKFNDVDASADDFWIHVNSNRFYILPDRDDNNSWDTPYAFILDNNTSTAEIYGQIAATRDWVNSNTINQTEGDARYDAIGAANDVNDRIDNEVLPSIPTNVSELTNDSGYITDGNTGWNNSYGFITASSTNTLTNKSGNISQWTNDAGYITDGNTNWNNSYGFITGVNWTEIAGDSANINLSQFTNDVGYITDGNTGWNNSYGFITASDSITGNAATATKLATARNIALSGAVTGSANFDGSGNITIAATATSDPTLTLAGDASGSATFTNLGNATLTVTVANDSHTHDGRYYTESESDARFVNVTGDTVTGDLAISGATLSVTSTAEGTEAFFVDGVNGRLFTISDDLSDSLFSANTISGLPVIEAFADNTVKLGPYSNPVVIDSSGNLSIGGTTAATESYVDTAISNLVGGAPGALDTLNELAAAINDDASFASSVTSSLALKAPLASPALTGTPTAPTQATSNNSTRIATTAFVKAQGYVTTDTNYYLNGISKSGNVLTFSVNGATNQTYTFGSNAFTSYSNHVGLYDSVGSATAVDLRIDNEVLPLIQTPAITSNGSTPSLNSGITAAEIRTLIGAGTSSSDTNYYLNGITKSGNTLTFSVAGATNQTYAFGSNAFTSYTDHSTQGYGSAADITAVNDRIDNEVLPIIATPAITSNGSTPSLNTGITAAEIRGLIGAQAAGSYLTTTGKAADSDLLDGLNPTSSATANSIVSRDASGDTSIRILSITNELRFPAGGGITDPTITCTTDGDTGLNFDGSGGMSFTSNGTKQFDFSEITTAIGWGNHASAGYASNTDLGAVNDRIDTEVLPAIPTNNNQLTNGAGYITDGNTNWNNTYGFITSSSNISGTSAGVVKTVSGTNSAELVRGNMGDNDQARILVGASASNAGYLEIATADDGTEPIYVRQYTGVFSTLQRTATLLDGSGNTSFPNTVTASTFSGALSGNASTATKLATTRNIALSGAVTGSANFDGSGNITIATTATSDPKLTLAGDATGTATFTNLGNATLTVTIADDSHNHVISNIDGLQTALNGKQAAGTYNTIIGTDSDINTSGSTIIDNIYVTDGVITSMGTRTLTAADLGIAKPDPAVITATNIVGETIEVVFEQSPTPNIDYYQVWSSVAGGSYGMIAQIPQSDIAATMTVIDASFSVSGTIAYRVYAVSNGIYSDPAEASQAFTTPTLDVVNLSVINLNSAYYIQYDMPNSRFVDHIEIYMDAETSSGSLSRTGASLIYSGNNTSYMYQISGAALNNYHQFWVEVIES